MSDKTREKKTRFINAGRRGFIQKSAIVGGAAVGAATTTASATTIPVATDSDVSNSKHAGYQLTDRVREYYKKARF